MPLLSPTGGPLDRSTHRQQQASLGRQASQTLRQNSLPRAAMVRVRAPVGRMLVAPRSGSAPGRRGAGGPRRLQAQTPTGGAVVSVGAGSSPPPADCVRRALCARLRPVAPRGRSGRRHVPRLWHPATTAQRLRVGPFCISDRLQRHGGPYGQRRGGRHRITESQRPPDLTTSPPSPAPDARGLPVRSSYSPTKNGSAPFGRAWISTAE